MSKILVVDDSKLARSRVVELLRENGYCDIYEALDGQQAIDMYLKHKPDLMTLDIEMPIYDGLEVVKELVQVSSDLKVIWISSVDNKHRVLEAQGLCKSTIIKKPISREKLEKALKIINR
ncbi:MAG: response regulator [Campylobacterota bacterium]|nr:response regulator [Campylobacterota bacterium]